ncbi:MAG: DNA-binding YbaB/EbfC family protein [Porticoccus sp.]|jgi:DNA-binding YbaB/EbfC family protein
MFKDGMDGLMQQAKVMQERMAKMQEELANAEVQGESGAGMVKVIMTGRHDVKKINVDPSLLTEDKEMLEDLVAAAVNDAVRKVETNSKNMMKDITGGIDMPAGFKMPF